MPARFTVWLCLPSARPIDEAAVCFERWRARGYKIACLRDGRVSDREELGVDLLVLQARQAYRGYAHSLNALSGLVLRYDPQCAIVVAAGDDMHPDPDHTAEQIGAQFLQRFPDTLGVMQPVGDFWPPDRDPATGRTGVERIAGSPWLGRAWCERAYRGRGPEWPLYYHSFNDQELQEVAETMGLFWQRPDLIHRHDHWARDSWDAEKPPHWNAVADAWDRDKAMYTSRKAAGFPMSSLRSA